MEDYVGLIKMFAGNTVPDGWVLCQGQQLSTSGEYAPLFGLIGYVYNTALTGTGNFQLPDLRGRVAVGSGTAATGTTYAVGQTGGAEKSVIGLANMPQHTHPVTGTVTLLSNPTPGMGTTSNPSGGYYALNEMFSEDPDGSGLYFGEDFTIGMPSTSTGTSVPFNNMQPYVCVNYMICYMGIYPQPYGGPAEDYVGMVQPFAGPFVPGGYLLCDGKTYSVREYAALGNLLGADSSGNFTVPNLIGRAAMGTVSASVPGQPAGSENTVLNVSNINNHAHQLNPMLSIPCSPMPPNTPDPSSTFPAMLNNGYATSGTVPMGEYTYNLTAASAGNASPAPIENRSPFTAVQYIICAGGEFPMNPN